MNNLSKLAKSTIVTVNGVTFFRPKKYPAVPLNDDDVYYEVGVYDNLGKISYDFYKTPDMNWFLSLANGIYDENVQLYAGLIIRVPQLVSFMNYMSRI